MLSEDRYSISRDGRTVVTMPAQTRKHRVGVVFGKGYGADRGGTRTGKLGSLRFCRLLQRRAERLGIIIYS